MTAVPRFFPEITAVNVQVAKPVSSLALGIAAQTEINHLEGYVLGGLRVAQTCEGTSSASSPVYRFKVHRHPNCDYLLVAVFTNVTVTQASSVAAKAGTGATTTIFTAAAGTTGGTYVGLRMAAIPWGAADSGDLEVSVTSTNVNVSAISISDICRADLGSGDNVALSRDATHSRIGHEEGLFIAESNDCGPHGLMQKIETAWTDLKRQIIGWSEDDADAFSTTSEVYVDVVGGTRGSLAHQARAKKSGTTTTDSTWHVRAWCDPSTEYKIYAYSGTDNAESAALSNTSAAWQTALTGVAVDNTADDALGLQVKRTSGAGTVYVSCVSSREDSS